MKELSVSDLKANLEYYPEDGEFYWKTSKSGRGRGKRKIGDKAGKVDSNGYVIISLLSQGYKAHRLAFLYMTGSMPSEVDHIDHNRANNKWDNIREVTRLENMRNKKMHKKNKTGFQGVREKEPGKFVSFCTEDGRYKYLGTFDNINSAILCRMKWEEETGFRDTVHLNHGS